MSSNSVQLWKLSFNQNSWGNQVHTILDDTCIIKHTIASILADDVRMKFVVHIDFCIVHWRFLQIETKSKWRRQIQVKRQRPTPVGNEKFILLTKNWHVSMHDHCTLFTNQFSDEGLQRFLRFLHFLRRPLQGDTVFLITEFHVDLLKNTHTLSCSWPVQNKILI